MNQAEGLRNVAIVELAKALYGEEKPGELSLRAAARVVDAIAAHGAELVRDLLQAESEVAKR